MNIEKMREEFEAWSANHEFLGCCFVVRLDSGKYRDFDLQCAWESWQASRAAIEVDLPFLFPHYRCDVVEVIESLGLRVKSI